MICLGSRKCKIKCCSFLHCCFGPNPAAMPFNDALYNGKPDASAFKLSAAVKTLEDAEKLFRVLHVETRPVVANEIHCLSILFEGTHFDDSLWLSPRKLECIGEKIDENLLEESG